MFFIGRVVSLMVICSSSTYGLNISGYNRIRDESFLGNINNDSQFSDSLCKSWTCFNGGTCKNNADGQGYTCSCAGNWKGKRCEKNDLCLPWSCMNGGTCNNNPDGKGYTCTCAGNWRGKRCEEKPCTKKPCKNGGICVESGNSFRCQCRFPYTGDICQDGGIETTPNVGTGSTIDTADDYQWTTIEPSKFPRIFNETTDTDQWTSNDTSEFPDVFNGTTETFQGTSNDTSEFPDIFNKSTESYEWTSHESSEFTDDLNATYNPSNFTDDFNVSLYEYKNFTESYNLTTIKPGICVEDHDCMNEGVCISTHSHFYCDCLPNFRGVRCEINMLCENLNSTCHAMGATCKVVGFKAICDCPQDKMYNPSSGLCESICDPFRCLHGKCEITERSYKCNCDSGYTGHTCNERIKMNPVPLHVWLLLITSLMTLMCMFLIGVICLYCRNRKWAREYNLSNG